MEDKREILTYASTAIDWPPPDMVTTQRRLKVISWILFALCAWIIAAIVRSLVVQPQASLASILLLTGTALFLGVFCWIQYQMVWRKSFFATTAMAAISTLLAIASGVLMTLSLLMGGFCAAVFLLLLLALFGSYSSMAKTWRDWLAMG